MKMTVGRRTLMVGAVGTLILGLIALAVLGVVGIAAWEYSNSDAFCANVCHGVHPEESILHKTSAHARVQCVECHMGRTSTLHLMALKPTHAKELWGMIAGYERPMHSSTLRPARENCENCHFPSAVHHDSIAVVKRYATDPKSSETEYRLTLHTTAGIERDTGRNTGIHWHISNDVEFVSTDPQSRNIPWVQVRRPDGSKVTYIDAESKLSAAEMQKLAPRRIECYDCHNAVGHPFRNPEDKVDQAIVEGRIDRSLPSVKERAVEMIKAFGEAGGPLEERTARAAKVIADNSARAKIGADLKEKEQKFQAAMKEILLNSSFSEKGLSWKSFPNHVGHKDFEGCFRCHDGKHFNDKGEAIRLQCTLCHNLPQVKLEKGGGSVQSTVAPGLTQPESHNAPNFMHDHRMKVDQSCEMCHGKLQFGKEGGNFCANPACHGRQWPGVNLNVQPADGKGAPPAAPADGGKKAADDSKKATPTKAAAKT